MSAIDYTGHLLFKAQGTADAVRAGTKLITRRLAREDRMDSGSRWRVGAWARCYERDPRAGGQPFGRVQILGTVREPLRAVLDYSQEELALEGLPLLNAEEFVHLVLTLHGLEDYANPLVWRVAFGSFTAALDAAAGGATK